MGLLMVRMIHPSVTREDLGLIPFWIDPDNPASARDQLDAEYQHAGGWRPFQGHTLLPDDSLSYPRTHR